VSKKPQVALRPVTEGEESTPQQTNVERAIAKIQLVCEEEGVDIAGAIRISDLQELVLAASYKGKHEGASSETELYTPIVKIISRL